MPPVAIATSASQSQGKPRPGQIWVVMIGVNQYRDSDLVSLQYAALDCAALRKVLEQTLQDSSHFLIHHDGCETLPERAAILSSFEKVRQNCQTQDTVLFYFSGHGIVDPSSQQVVLALADTHCSRLAESGIQMGELVTWLEQCPAERQFVWLDACHSGTFPKSNDPVPQLIDSLRHCAERSRNFFALLSCDQGQRSWEFKELGHGIFTHSLLHGLEGAAADAQGKITADSLYQFIYQQTLDYIETLNRQNRLLNQQRSSCGALLLPEYPQQTPKKIVEAIGEPVIGYCTERPIGRHFSALLLDNGTIPRLSLPFAKFLWEQGNYEVRYVEKGQLLVQRFQDQTLLLYLRGHLTDQLFIAEDGESYSQETLRSLLGSNASCQQLVILDCPTSTSCDCQNWIAALQSETSASCCLLACADFGFVAALFQTLKNTKSLSVPEWIGRLQNRGLDLHFHLSGSQILDILPRQVLYQNQKPTPDFDPGLCPYPGLQALDEENAPFFFGREALVVQLLKCIEHQPFIAVIGTSGSGKSSLVRAGLIAQLRQGTKIVGSQNWWFQTIRFGSSPLTALAQQLSMAAPLLSREDFVHWIDLRPEPLLVLVIDQFEELFTLGSLEEQELVLAMLLAGLNQAKNRFRLVVTLRVDCLSLCLQWPELASRLQSNTLLVPPYLSKEQYREAIEEPAELMGIHVEPELRDVLLNELSGRIGELPLLAFVLQQLWETRRGSMLTLASFQQELGGLQGALERHAENVLGRLDSKEARSCARWLFLSLVQLCESTEDTRRQIPHERLTSQQFKPTLIAATLETLVVNKLLVIDEKTVEIAHEVLIRKWPTLRQWLAESRASLIEQRQIEDEATRWKSRGQRPDELLRGERLSEVEKYYKDYRDRLSQVEISLIEASIKQKDQELKIASNRYNQTRIAAIVFGMLAFLAFFLAGTTYWQSLQARQQQISTLVTSSRLQLKDNQQLAAVIDILRAQHLIDSTWNIPPTLREQVNTALQIAYYSTQQVDRLEGHTSTIYQLRFSPDGLTIASASWDNTVRLWRLDGSPPRVLTGHTKWVMDVAFSPDGKTLASAGLDGTLRLWRVADGKLLRVLRGKGLNVNAVQFSPDGSLIASAYDNAIYLWTPSGKLLKILTGHIDRIYCLTFSHDGQTIFSGSYDGEIRLWSKDGVLLRILGKHEGALMGIGSDPNGKSFLSAALGGTIKLWNLKSGFSQNLTVEGVKAFTGVRFNPSGTEFAAAGSDGGIHLWKNDGTYLGALRGHSAQVFDVRYSPDGTLMASGSDDRNILIWRRSNLSRLVYPTQTAWISALAFDPKGKLLATGSGGNNERLGLWSPYGRLLSAIAAPNDSFALAFSSNGQIIATGGKNKKITIWTRAGKKISVFARQNTIINHLAFHPKEAILAASDIEGIVRFWTQDGKELSHIKDPDGEIFALQYNHDGSLLLTAAGNNIHLWNSNGKIIFTLRGHSGKINGGSFSPDGKMIASVSSDQTVRLWKVDGTLIKILTGHQGEVLSLAFDPSSNILATGSADKTIRLWNLSAGTSSVLHGLEDRVSALAFSPHSHILASGDGLGKLYFWYSQRSDSSWLKTQSCKLINPFLQHSRAKEVEIPLSSCGLSKF